jgi:hypothetical protein
MTKLFQDMDEPVPQTVSTLGAEKAIVNFEDLQVVVN